MRYSPGARDDADRIWIESATRCGIAQADMLLERIDATLARAIGALPHAGRLRPELGPHVRSYPIVPFVAFYRATENRVEVLRILHGHRDVKEPLVSLLIAG